MSGQADSGSRLRVVIPADATDPVLFPGKRRQYLVGLKAFVIKNIHDKGFYHVTLLPSITTPTYMSNGHCLMPIKSFAVLQDEELAVDLSGKIEYYVVDMTCSDVIQLQTCTDVGKQIKIDGLYILEFIELKDCQC